MNKEFLSIAINAAIKAGDKIMQIYNDPETDLSVEKKADNTPLTIADKASHNIIEKLLASTGFPILSEEGNTIPYEKRKKWETFWLVDPLDGTREFLKRNGEFTVNIALIDNNKSIAGVIYVPATKILYAALINEGAWKYNNHNGHTTFSEIMDKGEKLPCVSPPDTFTIFESRSHKSMMISDYIEKLKSKYGQVNTIAMGSSLKICMVAEGAVHEYPRFGPTMEWDTAAGHAIANAAGKKLMLTDLSAELTYNKENLKNPYFIALNGN